MSPFHPELARLARLLPYEGVGPTLLKAYRFLVPTKQRAPRSSATVAARLETLTRPDGSSQVLRVFHPRHAAGPRPMLLWIHGGGFLIGTPAQDDAVSLAFAEQLQCVVVAPTYRLAPEHPYPAPMDDVYAALKWLHANAAALNGRVDRIAIAGASAGGGLAAGLTLLARDRQKVPVAAQVLVYPMLDDRSHGAAHFSMHHRLWGIRSNAFGWRSYLGAGFGTEPIPAYAAPARANELQGLPPTWIGVGTVDLFHDEDVAYAQRLRAAGVTVELEIVPGAFHGFDAVRRKSQVAKDFFASQVRMLLRVLA